MTQARPGDGPTVADIVTAVESLYPPYLTESWDAVGLTCGVPDRAVRTILVAVDPVERVVRQALELGADLLLTHHPLMLHGVHSVAATSPAGRVITELIEGGCALMSAHTNADAARPGVSDALAEAIGLTELVPLQRLPESEPTMLLVIYVPAAYVDPLLDALDRAGAGTVGSYRRCAFVSDGTGTFDAPVSGTPFIGAAGDRATAQEVRLELTLPASAVPAAVAAIEAVHPYEQPAYEVLRTEATPRQTGIGRVGRLPAPETLQAFASRVAAALPATHHGVRVAGDLDAAITTVAVCGGAGDSLLPDAWSADVYLTADLRHHRVEEHLARGGSAVVDVAHWASEWPWCAQVGRLLPAALVTAGWAPDTVSIEVSSLPTDPWSAHVRSI